MAENITLARPYAKAVFQLAKAAGNYQAWSELLQVLALLAKDEQVVGLITAPMVSATDKVNLLINSGAKIFTDSEQEFIRLLLENGRFLIAAEIYQLFAKYRGEEEQTIQVDVCSAVPIEAAEQKALHLAINKYFNKSAIVSWRLDPSLIGGFIVKSEDKVFDGSVRSQLQALHTELVSA